DRRLRLRVHAGRGRLPDHQGAAGRERPAVALGRVRRVRPLDVRAPRRGRLPAQAPRRLTLPPRRPRPAAPAAAGTSAFHGPVPRGAGARRDSGALEIDVMSEGAGSGDRVDEVTSAMLTASRLLVAISARSLAAVEDAVTPAQFRRLVVLASQGPAKLV